MMQMPRVCITRGFRVPESQFDRKTSFQTRPNPPGGAQTKNVDWSAAKTPPFGGNGGKERGSTGARLSRGACIKTTTPVLYPSPKPKCGDLTSRSERPFWGHILEAGLGSRPVSAAGSEASRLGSSSRTLWRGSVSRPRPPHFLFPTIFIARRRIPHPAKPPHQTRVITPNHA